MYVVCVIWDAAIDIESMNEKYNKMVHLSVS